MSAIKKKNVQTRITLPRGLSEQQRELVGTKIIQMIKDRTRSGINAKDKPFPKYSTDYKESLDFKIAGKSDSVNLVQTGDMLADIEVLQHGNGYILVGYEMDYEEIGKVHGNVTGEYGQERSTGKTRDFIGLPYRMLRIAIAEAKDEAPTLQTEKDSIINNILSRLTTNNGK